MNKEIEWLEDFSRDPEFRYYKYRKDLFDIRKPAGWVYLIQLGDTDHYKIGMTTNLDSRLKQLQSKCPIPLKIIFRWYGHDYRFFELAFHSRFAKKRVKGEWFRLTTEDITWLIFTTPPDTFDYEVHIGNN